MKTSMSLPHVLMAPPGTLLVPSLAKRVPPFEKRGVMGDFDRRSFGSPSIPLFQRGKNASIGFHAENLLLRLHGGGDLKFSDESHFGLAGSR